MARWHRIAPCPTGPSGQLEEPDFGLAGTQGAAAGTEAAGRVGPRSRSRCERRAELQVTRGPGPGSLPGWGVSAGSGHAPRPVRTLQAGPGRSAGSATSVSGASASPWVRWGERPDGSPAARYRFSTPVLASSAPSASVAKFFCSRKCSKRRRRLSMASAGPGLAARPRLLLRAPAPPHTSPSATLPTALLRPRGAGLRPRPGLRLRPTSVANGRAGRAGGAGRAGRAGRARKMGPAPSPPPHCPPAGCSRQGREATGRGRGAAAESAYWPRGSGT